MIRRGREEEKRIFIDSGRCLSLSLGWNPDGMSKVFFVSQDSSGFFFPTVIDVSQQSLIVHLVCCSRIHASGLFSALFFGRRERSAHLLNAALGASVTSHGSAEGQRTFQWLRWVSAYISQT